MNLRLLDPLHPLLPNPPNPEPWKQGIRESSLIVPITILNQALIYPLFFVPETPDFDIASLFTTFFTLCMTQL